MMIPKNKKLKSGYDLIFANKRSIPLIFKLSTYEAKINPLFTSASIFKAYLDCDLDVDVLKSVGPYTKLKVNATMI